MRLIFDQSLAAGVIPINTQQQRASLPFKPSVLESKVYNNDDLTFFSLLTFAKPLCDVLHFFLKNYIDNATHYHTQAWQTLIHGKECCILLLNCKHLIVTTCFLFFLFFFQINYVNDISKPD